MNFIFSVQNALSMIVDYSKMVSFNGLSFYDFGRSIFYIFLSVSLLSMFIKSVLRNLNVVTDFVTLDLTTEEGGGYSLGGHSQVSTPPSRPMPGKNTRLQMIKELNKAAVAREEYLR